MDYANSAEFAFVTDASLSESGRRLQDLIGEMRLRPDEEALRRGAAGFGRDGIQLPPLEVLRRVRILTRIGTADAVVANVEMRILALLSRARLATLEFYRQREEIDAGVMEDFQAWSRVTAGSRRVAVLADAELRGRGAEHIVRLHEYGPQAAQMFDRVSVGRRDSRSMSPSCESGSLRGHGPRRPLAPIRGRACPGAGHLAEPFG